MSLEDDKAAVRAFVQAVDARDWDPPDEELARPGLKLFWGVRRLTG